MHFNFSHELSFINLAHEAGGPCEEDGLAAVELGDLAGGGGRGLHGGSRQD